MKNLGIKLIFVLLIPVPAFITNLAQAVSHPYEFHADASMEHVSRGPVEKAYGYMNLLTDTQGKGIINVMFSNGNQQQWARFNARIKFLNSAGRIIKEETFERWIAAADNQGAIEQRVARSLNLPDFHAVEVEFYLSDVPDKTTAEINRGRAVTVSNANGYLEN